MTDDLDTSLHLSPLFDGVPVMLRLVTGQDLIAVVYEPDDSDEEDDRLILQRPVLATVRAIVATGDSDTETVRVAMEPWMPLSASEMFPLYTDHVMCIAPIVEAAKKEYETVCVAFYGEPVGADPDSPEDIHKSYIDFLFHNLNSTKGKPN
jgi:hypothetical protein